MNATPATQDRGDEIVVAVDGSEPARAALTWAVREATGTGRRVTAVRVFDPAYLFAPPAPVFESIVTARAAEREALRESVAEAVGEDPAGIRLTRELLEGEPATEIARRADGASLLVMGSHGRGRVSVSLLGSVSAACVRRVSCPVLIISRKAVDRVLARPSGPAATTDQPRDPAEVTG